MYLGVDCLAAVRALVDDLGIETCQNAEAVLGSHGTLGRDVAPVEAPNDFGSRHSDGRAVDDDCRAQIDHDHGWGRDEDGRFCCNANKEVSDP